MDEATEIRRESYNSQRRELNVKGRNSIHGWCKRKILQMEKVTGKATVIEQGTK